MVLSNLKALFSKVDIGLIIVALLTLFIAQNLFQPGLPAGADLPIHLYRTLEYKNAWAPGVLVPRWSPNLVFGYGYPLFVFTPPLPHLIALMFYGLGFTIAASLKGLIILTILLYAIGMYLFVRDTLGSRAAALVAGVAYAFAPFALRESLLYGGNVPQFLAIAFFPWTLWAMTRAACYRSWGWMVWAALFYAAVMLSHLFQVLVFTPIAGLYGLLLFWLFFRQASNTSWLKRFVDASLPLLALPIGLLLSAFFWIPAFTERYLTRAQAEVYMEKSPFYIRYPYLAELIAWIYPLDARAANPYVPLTLGVVTLALAALGLVAAIILLIKKQRLATGTIVACRRLAPVYFIFFFALVAAGSIFLALPVSRWVWESVALLQVAEFPWRLLAPANLGLAFVAGAALLLPPPKFRLPLAALCVAVQILAVAPFLYPVVPFVQYGELTLADQVDYERTSQSVGTTTLSEFLPQTVTEPPTTSPLVPALRAGQNPPRLDFDSLPAGATATLRQQNAITHIYQLDTPVDFTLRLFHFDYPGWQAWLNDEPLNIQPQKDTGLMLFNIPAGQHTLTVKFGETPGRIVAMLLSIITVIAIIVGLVFISRRAKPLPEADEKPMVMRHKKWIFGAAVIIIIVVGALWLKPLLQPFFTIDSPPGQILPAQHQTDIHFDHGIKLVGYDVGAMVVSPGQRLPVTLYWETDAAPIPANLQPFVHLDKLNDFSTVADATNYTPGDVTTESVLPTFHWDTTRYVRDEHDLLLSPNIAPQAYAVRVGLIDPDTNALLPLVDGSGDTVWLTTVNVAPQFWAKADLANVLDIAFSNDDDTLQLTGFQLDAQIPERLNFSLAWRSDARPQKDYVMFAQLLDSGQNLAAGFDSPPLDGAYPTSTWLSEQTIIDPRHIPLDDVPAGTYRLIVGVYDPVTQQRLRINGGADFLELTTVTLEP